MSKPICPTCDSEMKETGDIIVGYSCIDKGHKFQISKHHGDKNKYY